MATRRHGELYERRDGDIGWRVRSANNNTTAWSGEGFKKKSAAEKALKREFPDLPIVDKAKKRT
jgi:uncharacterized protein YegP (UPF0339 family)